MSVLELLVGLQQVTQRVVELFLLHQRATFLMETHGQDQSLTTHTHNKTTEEEEHTQFQSRSIFL